ncbi:MAG: hypothetical protein KDE47_31405, partial [Caldilineaceae bacterium]|nr:hypothetical protein [Caldilineaceae bacterium]
LELYHAAENPSGISASTYQTALLAYRRGSISVAKALCLWAKEAQEKNEDIVSLLPTLRLLVDIALEEKEFDAANQYCARALDFSNQIHDRGELAATYYSLTVNARLQKEYNQAHTYAKEALALFELMGDRGFQALMHYELSRILAGTHSFTESIAIGLKSMKMFEDLSEDFNLVYVLQHLGALYCQLGDRVQATMLWQRALVIALAKEHPLTQGIQENLAQVAP